MRERRANTGVTENTRASQAGDGPSPLAKPSQTDNVEERFDLDWGSESSLVEHSTRSSGAQALSPTRELSRASIPKASPPRPANFPPIPKVSAWSNAAKEPAKPWRPDASKLQRLRSEPPSGSTRAYNHAELEQLLTNAGSLPSSLPPAQGNLSETVELDTAAKLASGAAALGSFETAPSPAESLFPPLRDTIHDGEDATTAYSPPTGRGMLDETISLEARQCWATPAAVNEPESPLLQPMSFPAADSAALLRAGSILEVVPTRPRPAQARRRLARLRRRRRARRLRAIGAITFMGCVALFGLVWGYAHFTQRSAAAPAAHGSLARLGNRGAPPEPNPMVAPRFVRLEISVEPAHAQLLLDGREASNPLKLSYPADDNMHEVKASAPGFQSRSYSVRFDGSVVILFGLTPAQQVLPPQ